MSNGCGCEKGVLKYIKPPYAKMFYVACVMHDDAYDRGGDERQRRAADTDLFRHMVQLVHRSEHKPPRIAWLTLIALLYYMSVRLFGRYFFNYK